ncbi:MAG TPA: alpha/beta fold hydrolase [Terracidiphilus sp.]|nr:alpha/beta fold hydrolase [Terracidiphilus sp.]
MSTAATLTLAALCMATSAAHGRTASRDGALRIAHLGKCALESGAVIEDCRIGYRTFGRLDAKRDNAVLMPSWLYGTSADLTSLFGDGSSPQHLVDTRKYFGIAMDALGNGVSSSPSNSKAQHGTNFPQFTERDMVETEYRVATEVLGLKHLHAVVGLSMGGEQTFDWSVAHPEYFDLAIPILGTPRLTPYDLETKTIQIGTIVDDPAYENGHYTTEPALKLANLFGNLVVTTPEARNAATTREGFPEFVKQAEAPITLDANDRVWQLRAIVKQDVIGGRTLQDAARAARTRFLVIVNANDHLVNPQPALDWARAAGAAMYVSHGSCGHLIMSCDAAAVSSRVREFLATGAITESEAH